MRRLSLAAVLLAALFAATPAQAQTKKAATAPATTATATATDGGPTMDNEISAFGLLSYRYGYGTGFGLGARYQKILLPASKSLLKLPNGIRDEIGIEGGIDFAHYSEGTSGFGYTYDVSYNRFDIVVGGVWNFWLNDKIAVYPKLDLGFGFGSASVSSNVPGFNSGSVKVNEDALVFQIAAGAVYRMDRLYLRAELGSAMLRLGAGFNF